MPLRRFFQGYLEQLHALGWAVELSSERIALYPATEQTQGKGHPTLVLTYDPIMLRPGPPAALVPAVRPFRLYHRRLFQCCAFPTLESAALLFLKAACETAPQREFPESGAPVARGQPGELHQC